MGPAERVGASVSVMRTSNRSHSRKQVLARRVVVGYEVIALTYVMVVIVTEGLESAVLPIVFATVGGIAFAFYWGSSD